MVVLISEVIGVPIGIWAAYRGGWVDETITRVWDMLLAFPPLLLAFAVVAAFGPGLAESRARPGHPLRAVHRARGAQRDARAERDGLHRGRAGARLRSGAHHLPAHPAQLRLADHRGLVNRHRLRAARPRRAVVPGTRRAAADPGLGNDALRRATGALDLAARGPGGRSRHRRWLCSASIFWATVCATCSIPGRRNDDAPPLLEIEDLRISFATRTSDVRAVDGVDLEIRPGEVLGLVGESGSGKSVTARSIMRLVPMPPGKLVSGRILFHGQDLTSLPEREMEDLRGSRIAMIFQDPMTFLNPLLTAGEQVSEAIRRHQGLDRAAARDEVIRLFREVGIPVPELRYGAYPHQLSGGLRQRVMIAMALSSRPELLIADEPTTALDVTIQAQILALLRDLQRDYGMSILAHHARPRVSSRRCATASR